MFIVPTTSESAFPFLVGDIILGYAWKPTLVEGLFNRLMSDELVYHDSGEWTDKFEYCLKE